MNLYELFKKFETEFLAGHEKIKTELDFELFVGKLSEQILGDVYSLDAVINTLFGDRRITYAVEYD